MARPLELLARAFFTAPAFLTAQAGARQFAGRTALNSGTTSITVSTTAITSDAIVHYGVQVSSINAALSSAGAIVVNSIVQGVSFAFAWGSGVSPPLNATIMWELKKTS